MKRIFFLILLFAGVNTQAQNKFPSVDSLQNYTFRYVKNSAVESFTNLRLQNILIGLSQMVDSLREGGYVDSIWIGTGDTLKYRIGNTNFVVGKISGGGGSTDSSIFATRWWVNDGFVPYTGGTKDVDLNGSNLSAREINITGTNGAGYLRLRNQASDPSGIGNHLTIFANSSGLPFYRVGTGSALPLAGSTPSLQQVTDVGNITTNAFIYKVGSDTLVKIDNRPIGGPIAYGRINLSSAFESGFTTLESSGLYLGNNGYSVLLRPRSGLTANRTLEVPDTSGNLGAFIKLNNTVYGFGANGLADLGTIAVTSTDNLDSVVQRGATTSQSITIGNLVVNENNGGDANITNIYNSDNGVGRIDFINTFNNGVTQIRVSPSNNVINITLPDTSGILAVGGIINGDTVMANSKGLINFGTVSGGGIPDSIYWATRNTVRSRYEEVAEFMPGPSSNTAVIPGTYFTQQWPSGGNTAFSQQDSATGVVQFSTLASAVSAPYISHLSFSSRISDTWISEFRIKIPTVNDGMDRYVIQVGYIGTSIVLNMVDGVFFTYDLSGSQTSSATSGNWQTVTAASSIRTFTTTSAPVVIGRWEKLTIKATTSAVHFYLNDVLISTHTTNIPTAYLTPYFTIRKTNGTNARTLLVDYYTHNIFYTNPR